MTFIGTNPSSSNTLPTAEIISPIVYTVIGNDPSSLESIPSSTIISPSTNTLTGTAILPNQMLLDPTQQQLQFDPTNGINEIVVDQSGSVLSQITIPSTVTDAKIDFQKFLLTESDGSRYVIIPNGFTTTASTTYGNVVITIPDELTITGPSAWTGSINLPQPQLKSTIDDGFIHIDSDDIESDVEVGGGDLSLTFDKAVRFDMVGDAGIRVGFLSDGLFHEITSICNDDTQDTNNLLPSGGDCKINVGSDLVIWTKHFTTFVSFTSSSPSQLGSGGGSTPGFAPSFTTGFSSNEYPLTINGTGIKFNNYQFAPVATQLIQTGKPFLMSLLLYGDYGASSIQHVTFFTNLYGSKREVQDSDTAIVWDRSTGVSLIDPYHFFGNVTANPTATSDGKFELDLTITFANPMHASDILIRTWGSDLYSTDVEVPNAWQATGVSYGTGLETETSTNNPFSMSDTTQPSISFSPQTPSEIKENMMLSSKPPSLLLSGNGNFTYNGQSFIPFGFNVSCQELSGDCGDSSIIIGHSKIPVNATLSSDLDGNPMVELESQNLQCNSYDLSPYVGSSGNIMVFECTEPLGSGISYNALFSHR